MERCDVTLHRENTLLREEVLEVSKRLRKHICTEYDERTGQ